MPINKHKEESQDDFISRCIRDEVGSGKEQSQAVAICYSYAKQDLNEQAFQWMTKTQYFQQPNAKRVWERWPAKVKQKPE